jgi:hypothetical protein
MPLLHSSRSQVNVRASVRTRVNGSTNTIPTGCRSPCGGQLRAGRGCYCTVGQRHTEECISVGDEHIREMRLRTAMETRYNNGTDDDRGDRGSDGAAGMNWAGSKCRSPCRRFRGKENRWADTPGFPRRSFSVITRARGMRMATLPIRAHPIVHPSPAASNTSRPSLTPTAPFFPVSNLLVAL